MDTAKNLAGMTRNGARLVVEKGSPFLQGAFFELNRTRTVIGRATADFRPDIGFDTLLISRRHCCVEQRGRGFAVAEMGSKHGTAVNGSRLGELARCGLNDGDVIDLADGVVRLRFLCLADLDNTLDFGSVPLAGDTQNSAPVPFFVDLAKRTLHIQGEEIALPVKEWRLLELLYRHQSELVAYETIRSEVWAERRLDANEPPDVGLDEMNVLLHRLRRKLGEYDKCLVTRRGQGCMLDFSHL